MIIFGHRGASGYAPQNTMAAFKIALEQGCQGIEVDAQLTKDGEVVICHDWAIDKVSDGKGKIEKYTLNEIKKIDFGSYFSEKFKGEKIPTLYEILDFLPRNIILNIELKIKAYDDSLLAEKVAEILIEKDRIENTIVSSFYHPCLKKIKLLIPEIKIALLYKGYLLNPIKYAADIGFDIYSFNLNVDYVNKDTIKNFHDNGKKVYVWTSNDTETTKKLLKMDVDGIITNFPVDMLNILTETLKKSEY